MDKKRAAIRSMIESMAPIKSVPLVKSFQLCRLEEQCILLVECKGRDKLSVQQLCEKFNSSPETIKRARKSAFEKIYNYYYE